MSTCGYVVVSTRLWLNVGLHRPILTRWLVEILVEIVQNSHSAQLGSALYKYDITENWKIIKNKNIYENIAL